VVLVVGVVVVVELLLPVAQPVLVPGEPAVLVVPVVLLEPEPLPFWLFWDHSS
jgi:hypothetical protein